MKLFAIALLILVSGCTSQVVKVTDPLITRDITSFVNLANKYGSPSEQRCASYLQGAWADKSGLAQEDADGLLANAYKVMLLSRHINSSESAFKAECGGMAGELMIAVGQQMRR